MTKEDPAPYDSQANGFVEVGILLMRGIFRTLKLCLESRIQHRIPIDHAIVPWLVTHACLILNTSAVGPDGITAWTRARGRPFTQKPLHFGEKVLYKLPVKGPFSQPDGKCTD